MAVNDAFGNQLEKGDSVLIDAKVVELFDPEEDEIHVRVELTNGGQSLVLKAASMVKVQEELVDSAPPAGLKTTDSGAPGGDGSNADDVKKDADDKKQPDGKGKTKVAK